jgi:hypothetical protein
VLLLWERSMHPYEMATTLRERRKACSTRFSKGLLSDIKRDTGGLRGGPTELRKNMLKSKVDASKAARHPKLARKEKKV